MNSIELNQHRHFASAGLVLRCRKFLPEDAIIENEVSSEHVAGDNGSQYTAVVDLWWTRDCKKYLTSIYTRDFISYTLETTHFIGETDDGVLVDEQSGQFVEIVKDTNENTFIVLQK